MRYSQLFLIHSKLLQFLLKTNKKDSRTCLFLFFLFRRFLFSCLLFCRLLRSFFLGRFLSCSHFFTSLYLVNRVNKLLYINLITTNLFKYLSKISNSKLILLKINLPTTKLKGRQPREQH